MAFTVGWWSEIVAFGLGPTNPSLPPKPKPFLISYQKSISIAIILNGLSLQWRLLSCFFLVKYLFFLFLFILSYLYLHLHFHLHLYKYYFPYVSYINLHKTHISNWPHLVLCILHFSIITSQFLNWDFFSPQCSRTDQLSRYAWKKKC